MDNLSPPLSVTGDTKEDAKPDLTSGEHTTHIDFPTRENHEGGQAGHQALPADLKGPHTDDKDHVDERQAVGPYDGSP